jgi:DNA-binding CsgD family transcriptional regulator
MSDRQVDGRARYIAGATDISRTTAQALAYSELGYSTSGIAGQLDCAESTARGYLDRIIARFGPRAAEVRLEFEMYRDLEPVTVNDVERWDATEEHLFEVYREKVERCPDCADDAVVSRVAELADDGDDATDTAIGGGDTNA